MLNNIPIEQVIRQRFSCRTYVDKPIAEETRQRLADALAAAHEGPLGSHARFQLLAATEDDYRALQGLGTYGFIRGATGFIVGAVKEGPKNLEDLGYLTEELVLLATALGLGTCWLGGTFTRSRFAEAINLQADESMPAVVAVGYIAEKRTVMDRVIRRTARSDNRLSWQQLFFDGTFDLALSPEAAGTFALPLEMVRLGPSASNRQPWRIVKEGSTWHFYLRRTPGYNRARLGGWLQILDLQRGDMGIAMSHFALTAQELDLHGQWVVQDPALPRPDDLTEYTVTWL
ncbi:MAG: nitroreductase [Chloroflexi bacterium]|nr:nitroreductase [Chloroflexota bacterium]